MRTNRFLKILIVCLAIGLICCVVLYVRNCSESTSPSSVVTENATLKLYGTDPTTLDPALVMDANSAQFVIQIFSGLLKLDKNLEPVSDIAERWDVSQDKCTYTFYLRDDVTFQDGRKVTASDFKYSWERACDPATGSSVAGLYLGDIVGVAAVIAGQTKEISGVQVINDSTLQVTIDTPKSYFLWKMSYTTAMVVDKNNVATGSTWWRQPNGTGPFKLKEWQQGNLFVLERNNNYYGKVASLQSVEFQMYTGDQINLYETGQLDVAGIYANYIDKITDPLGPFFNELHTYPQLNFSWIGFDVTKPPFDDINIRKAFSMAIDKDKIINLTWRNLVQRADGVLPPGLPGYNENLVGLKYDVDEAKALIAASSYGSVENLPPIVWTTSGYGGAVSQIVESIITQWRENLGVEVTVRQLETDYFLYHLKDEVDNMYDMGWIADYPHPQDFLEVLFRTGAEYNYGKYSNPAYDLLVQQAGVEEDFTKSMELYQQAEQMLVDDDAILPLWFMESYILVKPYVEGYELNALGYVMFNEVSIKEH